MSKEIYKKAVNQIHASEILKSDTLEKIKQKERKEIIFLL